MTATSLKRRLVINVGVTGHRMNKLSKMDEPALREKIKEVLCHVKSIALDCKNLWKDYFNESDPFFRIVSPLAEGADRIVAQVGLGLGFELQSPLPFNKEEYENDFISLESKNEFRLLLESASSVFELDGSRKNEPQAYLEAGNVVLNHCDMLIAIWDGNGGNGIGGTGHIISEALKRDIPIIWILSDAPHSINLIENGYKYINDYKEQLKNRLRSVLISDGKMYFFEEKMHGWNSSFLYSLFEKVLSKDRPLVPPILIGDYINKTTKDLDASNLKAPDNVRHIFNLLNEKFANPFGWADHLANHYAGLYRSSFLLRYLLVAISVLFAFIGSSHIYGYVIQIFVLSFLIWLTWYGRRKKDWHKRFLDYRLLAELLRHTRSLYPLGRVMSTINFPAYHSHSNSNWVLWYHRLIIREIGLVDIRLDSDYLASYRNVFIKQHITSQIDYHNRTANRYKSCFNGLNSLTQKLFIITFVSVLLRLLIHGPYTLVLVISIVCTVFPAFGAALTGIRSQGEYQRMYRNSESLVEKLEYIKKDLEEYAPSSTAELGGLVDYACMTMIEETIDWNIVLKGRPIPTLN